MKSFNCTLTVNNGRFDRKRVIRVEATTIRVAFAKAAKHIREIVPKRQHIASVSIDIVPIKPVVIKEIVEEVEGEKHTRLEIAKNNNVILTL